MKFLEKLKPTEYWKFLPTNQTSHKKKEIVIWIILILLFSWYINIVLNTLHWKYNPFTYWKIIPMKEISLNILKVNWVVNSSPSFFSGNNEKFNSMIKEAKSSESPYVLYEKFSWEYNTYNSKLIWILTQSTEESFKEKEREIPYKHYNDFTGIGIGNFLINNIKGKWDINNGTVQQYINQSWKYSFVKTETKLLKTINNITTDTYLQNEINTDSFRGKIEEIDSKISSFNQFLNKINFLCDYSNLQVNIYRDNTETTWNIWWYYAKWTENIYLNISNSNSLYDEINKELVNRAFFHEMLHYCFYKKYNDNLFNDEILSYSLSYWKFITTKDSTSFKWTLQSLNTVLNNYKQKGEQSLLSVWGYESLVFFVFVNHYGEKAYINILEVLDETRWLQSFFKGNSKEYTQFVLINLYNRLQWNKELLQKEIALKEFERLFWKIGSAYELK